MFKRLTQIALTLVASIAVFACGGGGGGSSQVAGIDRLGVNSGTVTGFGSIFVNGVEFRTDSAVFDIDDDSSGSSESDLEVGDVVIVTFDPGVSASTAEIVFSDEAVEGPIDSIDALAGTMVVAGQTVVVDGATSFDDSIGTPSLAGLNPGDFVEIHGLFDAAGAIRATRIEPGGGEVEVHGPVSMLDTGALTFMINALPVDYSSADVGDLSGGAPVEGRIVEAKGAINGGTLVATKVEPDGLDAIGIDPDTFDEVEIEIEGFITRFVSATNFDVAGRRVTTNSGTSFEGGTAADLALNVKVEVEGRLNNSGVLLADKVDIRRSNDLRVTALVDQVPPASAPNTTVVLGVQVRVDALTRLEDKSNAKVEPFSLGDISVGDYVEARGGADPMGGNGILASRLEREDVPSPPGSDTELRGIVEAVNPPNFTVAGVTVVTDGGTSFINVAGAGSLQPGDLVDVDGTETGQTTLAAGEVKLEN